MGQFCGHKMHTCNHCQKIFFSKQSLTRHIMNITCKEIHNHINHLISINTPDDMIIESLKTKFQLKDFNFMEIHHRLNLLKHEYAKKKIIVRNYVENALSTTTSTIDIRKLSNIFITTSTILRLHQRNLQTK